MMKCVMSAGKEEERSIDFEEARRKKYAKKFCDRERNDREKKGEKRAGTAFPF